MRSLQRAIVVLGLVVSTGGLAQAAPRVRDAWHSYAAGGQRSGYVHTVVVRLRTLNAEEPAFKDADAA